MEFALNLPITMAPTRRTLAFALCVTLGQALRLGPQIFSRRAALAQGAALAVTPLAIPLRPALADVYGANSELPTDLKGINKFLKTQGFPAMPNANGLTPLMKYVGTAAAANLDGLKSKERAFSETLLVRWNFPSGWLITSPDITENGEAGTLGANNFIKGDSEVRGASLVASISHAFQTAHPRPGAGVRRREDGGRQAAQGAEQGVLHQAALIAGAPTPTPAGVHLHCYCRPPLPWYDCGLPSQMTSDVYEDIKPKKIKPVTTDDGTEMVGRARARALTLTLTLALTLALTLTLTRTRTFALTLALTLTLTPSRVQVLFDFTYTLLTRAGFTVERRGVASALQLNSDTAVALVCATTALRRSSSRRTRGPSQPRLPRASHGPPTGLPREALPAAPGPAPEQALHQTTNMV